MKQIFWLKANNIASIYAARAHLGQYRKDGVTPFVMHPARVASLVSHFGGKPTTIISAWFHDILEDCPGNPEAEFIIPALTEAEILPGTYACADILANVKFMTKDMSLDKKEREKEFLSRLELALPQQGLLKICDRLDNLIDLPNVPYVSAEWRTSYIGGSTQFLEHLPASTEAAFPNAVYELECLVSALRKVSKNET